LENVVKTARNLVPAGGKLICVFGCGGDRDPSKRPQMGEIAENYADEVVVTSDNPRTEDPQHIIANILAGIRRMNRIKVEPDRSTAIRMTIREAGSKDVVVIAGKGHENYQILADKIIPFDDRTEVRLALEERARMLAQRG
jgi:UDP-N-acetylmuramoyl-L-alanyl-D-glutamate--2,6-diaminopimelate ligase